MAKKEKTLHASMDIGIGAGDRAAIVEGLAAPLADSYLLYLMTHNFHWNVTGLQFNGLHKRTNDITGVGSAKGHADHFKT